MPGMVGRCAGAAGEFGVGAFRETPGPGCGVTEMGVMPWTVGRVATSDRGLGAATPGEPGRGLGAATPGEPGRGPEVPCEYAAGGMGGMPGTVGRSEGEMAAGPTVATPGMVGRSPGGTREGCAGMGADVAPGGRGGWAACAPGAGGRGAAVPGTGGEAGMAPEDTVR
jgi:hypothetical protein